MKFFMLIAGLLLSSSAFAVDASTIKPHDQIKSTYSWSKEKLDGVSQEWWTAKSGPVMAGKQVAGPGYKFGLSGSLATIFSANNKLMDRVYVEAMSDSRTSMYYLVGMEVPTFYFEGWNLFLAGVVNEGENYRVRPVGGPIWYWGEKSYSALFMYANWGAEGEKKSTTFSLRNRVYVLDSAFLIADVSPRFVDSEVAWGWKAGAQVGPLAAYAEYTPKWEGTSITRESINISATFPLF